MVSCEWPSASRSSEIATSSSSASGSRGPSPRRRRTRSLNGVLHAAEAFGRLGDRSTVDQCMRVAEGLVALSGDGADVDRVRILGTRLAEQSLVEEHGAV